MSNWKNDYRYINVDDLHLDLSNPRTDSGGKQTEVDIIKELLDENVIELAQDIVQNGYAPTSVLMAVEDNGKFVVIEGNRRLMALKLINSPEIIQGVTEPRIAAKVKALHNENHEDLSSATVIVYPSRVVAEKDMAKLHLDGVSIQRWRPIRQYRYFQKRITEDEISIDTLSELLAINKPIIKKGIKTYQLFEMAKNNLYDLVDELNFDIFSDKNFKTDKFQRAVVNSEGERLLGYKFSDTTQKIQIDSQRIFLDRLRKVLIEIYDLEPQYLLGAQFTAKNRDTFFKSIDQHFLSETEYRRIKKKEQDLIGGGQEALFDHDKNFSTPTFETTANTGAQQTKTNSQGSEKGTLPKPDWVVESDVRLYQGADRVKDILRELRKNAPTKGTNLNVVVVALRIVVELALYHKLNEKGVITTMIKGKSAELNAENARRIAANKPIRTPIKNWSPSLKEMLAYVTDEANSIITDPQERKSFDLLLKNHNDFVDDLDNFVHNVTYNPTETVARDTWKTFARPVFDILKKL